MPSPADTELLKKIAAIIKGIEGESKGIFTPKLELTFPKEMSDLATLTLGRHNFTFTLKALRTSLGQEMLGLLQAAKPEEAKEKFLEPFSHFIKASMSDKENPIATCLTNAVALQDLEERRRSIHSRRQSIQSASSASDDHSTQVQSDESSYNSEDWSTSKSNSAGSAATAAGSNKETPGSKRGSGSDSDSSSPPKREAVISKEKAPETAVEPEQPATRPRVTIRPRPTEEIYKALGIKQAKPEGKVNFNVKEAFAARLRSAKKQTYI